VPPGLPPDFGPGGIFGSIGRMIAEQAKASDPLERLAKNSILGGIPKIIAASASPGSASFAASRGLFGSLANLQPESSNAQANPSYAPGWRSFMSPEPVGYSAGGPYMPASSGRNPYAYPPSDPLNFPDSAGLSSDFAANRGTNSGLLDPLTGDPGSGLGGTSDIGNAAAALTAGTNSGLTESPGGPVPGDQLAQAFIFGLPPSFFLAEPPVKFGPTPEGFTPLEELPPGSAGGVAAGKRFPDPNPYPEGTPCTYCRQPTTNQPRRPNSLERDHIIPRGRGGDGDEGNRLPSCRTCNRQKGPRTPEEWYRSRSPRDDA
jgi:hypothetical protein